MAKYASTTKVSSDKSRAEIESILRRYGADQFMYGWTEAGAVIGFRYNGRAVKFLLPMPDRGSEEFKMTKAKRYMLDDAGRERAYEQAVRQRWRALALCIKAKLEAVEAGIVTFDDEFLAHLVLPGGQTVGQRWGAEYQAMLDGGRNIPLLPE